MKKPPEGGGNQRQAPEFLVQPFNGGCHVNSTVQISLVRAGLAEDIRP
jgi:hypothetical protein